MSGDEPRRSGRATKGQHNKHGSTSPGPVPQGETKKKKGGKSDKRAAATQASDEEDEGEEVIRCICGNDNPSDKRAFIGCDSCSVWQHNVCMGMPDDEDEVGEHYFCEQCGPDDHKETLEALARGEKIWETRNKLWQNDKKKGKNRKSKGDEKQAWLKKELRDEDEPSTKEHTPAENGNKRKRAIKEENEDEGEDTSAPDKPSRAPRKDKRRKAEASEDPDTAVVPLAKLPSDRQKIAKALGTLIAEDIKDRVASKTYKLPKDQSAEDLGEHHALRIEYALHINHGGPASAGYIPQFRTLNANLKKNKTLIQELLAGHLTADELSTMSSSDMASEELQKERAAMKAESDRQAVIDQRDDGPRYRRTHKGDEIVEAEGAASSSAPISRPVRHSVSETDTADNPVNTAGSPTGTDVPSASKESFDMKDIWAKAGTAAARPLHMPARRRSSLQQVPVDGTKVDADVDRLLADDDNDEYAPENLSSDIVWRGKIVHTTGDHEPTVNARWVAGRDVSHTVAWTSLLADKLNIDGRLQIEKAEQYLCGLQWSKTSDVSVLALTPYDDADAFDKVFTYFKTRARYAVVNKDKPAPLVKDLYIIPVDVGAKLPEHIEMLEHCTIKKPIEEKLLLATFVVARAPVETNSTEAASQKSPTDGRQHTHIHAPQGPAGSPLTTSGPQFSPAPQNGGTPQYAQSYPAANPYAHQQPALSAEVLRMANEILGDLVNCPTARRVMAEGAAGLGRDQVVNLKRIFEEDPVTRTDFDAFLLRLSVART